MAHRIKVEEAAQQLGMRKQGLQDRMKAGQFKEIGIALPGINGSTKHEYFIYQEKIDRYLGISQDTEDIIYNPILADCLYNGIYSRIEKEIQQGTTDITPQLQYAVAFYCKKYMVLGQQLQGKMEEYRRKMTYQKQ
ncbi:MAG: hypothetical protein K2N61_13305 [Lachnospiraceae bacterium]|nr:hypothetical protein [Lachnospiraceae bacterium]